MPLTPIGVALSFVGPNRLGEEGTLGWVAILAASGFVPGGTLLWWAFYYVLSKWSSPPLADAFLAIRLLGYFLIIFSSIRIARSGRTKTR